MRILYAEDKADYARDQKSVLEMWGYSVEHASSQSQAEGRIRNSACRVDIGLFDMRMESWTSGVDLARLTRHTCPDAPVVILTAFAELKTAVPCMEAGTVTYVDKNNAGVDLRPSLLRAAGERVARLRTLLDKTHADWWTTVGMAEIIGQDTIKVRHGFTGLALTRLCVPPPPAANSPEMELENLFRLLPGQQGGFGSSKARTSLGRAINPEPLANYMQASQINGTATRKCAIKGDWAHLDLVYPHPMNDQRLADLNRTLSGHIKATDLEIRFSVFPMELTAIGAVAWATVEGKTTTVSVRVQVQYSP